jgi:hypothetical protein
MTLSNEYKANAIFTLWRKATTRLLQFTSIKLSDSELYELKWEIYPLFTKVTDGNAGYFEECNIRIRDIKDSPFITLIYEYDLTLQFFDDSPKPTIQIDCAVKIIFNDQILQQNHLEYCSHKWQQIS